MLAAALFTVGILLTPPVGLLCYRLLLRTGWVTDGVTERTVWWSGTPQERYAFPSRLHSAVAFVVGFLVPWVLTVVAYVFAVDRLLATPPI